MWKTAKQNKTSIERVCSFLYRKQSKNKTSIESVWMGIHETVRVGTECAIGEVQCGFSHSRGCMNQVFAVRQVCDKYLANKKDVFWAFIDLEMAYDTIDRHCMWQMLRGNGVGGKLLKAMQNFYIDILGRVPEWEMIWVSGFRLILNWDKVVSIFFLLNFVLNIFYFTAYSYCTASLHANNHWWALI